jgi:hypothetical protein
VSVFGHGSSLVSEANGVPSLFDPVSGGVGHSSVHGVGLTECFCPFEHKFMELVLCFLPFDHEDVSVDGFDVPGSSSFDSENSDSKHSLGSVLSRSHSHEGN